MPWLEFVSKIWFFNLALKAEGLIEGGEQQIQQYVPQQQPQYPIQIQNSTETVIMEVHPGMQITLPTPDGQNQAGWKNFSIEDNSSHLFSRTVIQFLPDLN